MVILMWIKIILLRKGRVYRNYLHCFLKCPHHYKLKFSVFLIGIMRKSERNILISIDTQIYDQVFDILHQTDDTVVADLLIDILTVLTSLTISAHQLKLLLRYLKTERHTWVSELK